MCKMTYAFTMISLLGFEGNEITKQDLQTDDGNE